MAQHIHPLIKHKNLKLKDLIIKILRESTTVITLDEILIRVRNSKIFYNVDKKILRRLINKLVKKGLLEYVYLDLSYGIRLIESHNNDYNLEAAT